MREGEEHLQWVQFAGIRLLYDEKTETVYVKRCVECEKLLTAEEAEYGHDCE